MKVALVHDDFIQTGGAESLFATIVSLWPNAPIYTSLVDWNKLPASISRNRVRSSFIQKIPFATKLYKILLPLYPLSFESFDFSDFDLVISSTTRFAKSIITKPGTVHICYINNVPRFLWDKDIRSDYLPALFRFLLAPILGWLKKWDKAASSRVDHYIANSQNVKDRLRQHYGWGCEIVYPFADLSFFKIARIHKWQIFSQDYFLVVTRLVKWKKIDLAIRVAKSLGISLKIVGTGPDEGRLKRQAAKSQQLKADIEFIGKVTNEELREFYQNCQALIVTQEEDFGIAALEAQACGIPVIAFDAGGLREIIVDGKTGILYKNQSEENLKDAILASRDVKWSQSACRKNSLKFSQVTFVRQLKRVVQKVHANS